VPEDKGDVLTSAQIGKPVPGEDAFDSNYDIFPVSGNCSQKYFRVRSDVPLEFDFSFLIEDTKIHGLGMQIDATVKFVLLGVKSHLRPPLEKDFGFLNHTCFGYGSGGP